MLTATDRETLRALADEHMRLATSPEMIGKIPLWKALNRGEMQRPMVLIDQLPWNELSVSEELTCTASDPFWCYIEQQLRFNLYKARHFPVDMVLQPFISIPKAVGNTGYGLAPQVDLLGETGTCAYSQHFTNQLTGMADVEKFTDMHISHDEQETARRMEEAAEIFGGFAPVKATGTNFHLGIWDYLSALMSVEDVYYALIDDPELLRAALERLTVSTITGIEEANALGLFNDTDNLCHCSHIYTDELLPDSGQGKGPNSKNCWAFGLAQLFTSVSNEVFEEFELPYISRMADYYGMIYYGCCDRLDHRLDLVKRIPNVKKVSCSPWSDRRHFAEEIGPTLTMSVKPNPAYLAGADFDEKIIRDDLQENCDLAREHHVNLEMILKDVSTVNCKPERLTRWAEIAMEVVQG